MIKCKRSIIVAIALIMALLLILYFGKKLLTEYSQACQGIGALANIGLVYYIYRLSRNDIVNDYKKENDKKWYLDIIIPKFVSQINECIEKHIMDLEELRNTKSKEELLKILTDNNYKEQELLNNIKYFSEKLFENLRNNIDDFYDKEINSISLCIIDEHYIKTYTKKIKKHRADIYEMLYLHLKSI